MAKTTSERSRPVSLLLVVHNADPDTNEAFQVVSVLDLKSFANH